MKVGGIGIIIERRDIEDPNFDGIRGLFIVANHCTGLRISANLNVAFG